MFTSWIILIRYKYLLHTFEDICIWFIPFLKKMFVETYKKCCIINTSPEK